MDVIQSALSAIFPVEWLPFPQALIPVHHKHQTLQLITIQIEPIQFAKVDSYKAMYLA